MGKAQTELEAGSPAESSIYGRQDEYPTVYNLEAPEYFPPKRRKLSGMKSPTFHKSTVVLGVALLFCCVAAAVASYFAVEFWDRARLCSSHQSPASSQHLNSTAPITDPPAPTSSCLGLNNTYTSAIDSTRFTAQCGTWYQGNNLLGVYVYTFEACMDACASYNSYEYQHDASRCYSITYDAVKEDAGRGNCWLKSRQNITATARNVTDSAVLS